MTHKSYDPLLFCKASQASTSLKRSSKLRALGSSSARVHQGVSQLCDEASVPTWLSIGKERKVTQKRILAALVSLKCIISCHEVVLRLTGSLQPKSSVAAEICSN